jgi:hypothetical protein
MLGRIAVDVHAMKAAAGHGALALAVALGAALASRHAMAANALAGSPSPYLAMHAGDPVAWRPWDAAALAEARRRGVPLLVSVGFFSCHWCHVLQRESFRDPETAALINDNFVPVKVDRELDGALDAALQAFAHRQSGRRGWPLQVLVLPDGYPAAAGFYERPGEFRATLAGWASRWRGDRGGLARAARALAAPAAAPTAARAEVTQDASAALRARFVSDALQHADFLQGGFGSGARFAAAPRLLALLEFQRRAPDPRLADFLRVTFDALRAQGLRDHLWGGFFRYTADPDWREPHFEKMLSDNALLALAFLRAAGVMDEPRYRHVALETLAFMRRELWNARALAFATGLSAESAAGADGGRYLWSSAELAALLPAPEGAVVARVWDLGSARADGPGALPLEARAPDAAERKLLESAYRRLRASRAAGRSTLDPKLLAGWNGLALAAFAEAAPHDPRARETAGALRRFVERSLWDGKRLRKLADPAAASAAELEDYAFVAWGLERYAALTGAAQDRALGAAVAQAAWRRFYRDGWLQQEEPLLAGIGPEAVVADGHVPSASATLVLASLGLGDAALEAQARDALALGVRAPPEGALNWGTQALALDRAVRGTPGAGLAGPAPRARGDAVRRSGEAR